VAIYFDVNGEAGETVQESRIGASSFFLRKMILGGKLSFARVDGDGYEGCVVGIEVGRCALKAVYLAYSPSSKPSSAASTRGDWLYCPVTIGERL
jgi:hypothetical protein